MKEYLYNNQTIEILDAFVDIMNQYDKQSQPTFRGDKIWIKWKDKKTNAELTYIEIPHYFKYLQEQGLGKILDPLTFKPNYFELKNFGQFGGFKKLVENQNNKGKEEAELRGLKLVELRTRIENLEKQLTEQSDFWTTSSKVNKEKFYYIKDKSLIIWITLILAILSFLQSFWS